MMRPFGISACRWLATFVVVCFAGTAGFEQDGKQPTAALPERRSIQSSPRYCGTEALYAALVAAARTDVSLGEIEERARPGREGVSVQTLTEAARQAGVRAEAVHASLADLMAWGRPAVLHVNQRHYIALLDSAGGKLLIYDNSVGAIELTRDEFAKNYAWKGFAVIIGGVPPRWQVVMQSPLPIPGALAVVVLFEVVRRMRRKPRVALAPATASA